MTKLKTRNISKKKSSWNIDLEILQTFENNPNYKKSSPDIIKKQVPKFQELIKKAQEFFKNGKFIDTAKVFRQLARVTRQIEYDCEIKGDYNEKNQLNDLTGKEWLRHTKSWLVIDGKPSDIPDEIKDHPASYPPDLAKHFIEFFTKEDDWVFDPFMGIGSTLVACMELKRNCWGVELNPKYAEYAQKRTITSKQTQIDEFVKQTGKKKVYNIFNADCRESFKIWEEMKYPKVKFLFTSPPYFNILEKSRGGVKSALKQRVSQGFDEKYSDDSRDLGNINEYDKYLDEISSVFRQFINFIIPGGYIMIVVQNFRPKDGIMRPLAWDLAKKLDFLILRQEFIWCQDQKFMGIWGYPTTYVSNVHHHYCLVFQIPK